MKQQIGLKLDADLLEATDTAAEEAGLSRTAFIEQALARTMEPTTPPPPVSGLPPNFTPTAEAKAIDLGDGRRAFPPPEGTDPATFWERVKEIHGEGVPIYNASKIARKEFLHGPPNALAIAGRDITPPLTEEQKRLMSSVMEKANA